jgi:methyl-accepting chemotaxis protein
LSFFAFIRIFLLWICIYFFINKKQTNLDQFTNHLTHLQNNYADGNRYLQNFILSGYHEPSFYTTGRQKDIDRFFEEQDTILLDLEKIDQEAKSDHIDITGELQALSKLHNDMLDTAKLLKDFYLLKGFKDYGSEGTMRRYAHFLEDSSQMMKMDILMLRRREKDYMLREDKKYIDEFNVIADAQIKKFSSTPATLSSLVSYRKYFNDFAAYSERLSINTDHGMYGHLQYIISKLDNEYIVTNTKAVNEIAKLDAFFKAVLIVTFIILLLAAVYLSMALSNDLTKDIKTLSKNVSDFVGSGFKDDEDGKSPPESKITEIQGLNNDFALLKQTLTATLSELKNSVREEKNMSANMEKTITKLKEQIMELERQKKEKENS